MNNPATESLKQLSFKPFVPSRQKRRWLLWIARRCYFWFLRANGWKSQFLPSPLKGGGLILKWSRVIDNKRYVLTTEDALFTESRLHQARQRREAAMEGER